MPRRSPRYAANLGLNPARSLRPLAHGFDDGGVLLPKAVCTSRSKVESSSEKSTDCAAACAAAGGAGSGLLHGAATTTCDPPGSDGGGEVVAHALTVSSIAHRDSAQAISFDLVRTFGLLSLLCAGLEFRLPVGERLLIGSVLEVELRLPLSLKGCDVGLVGGLLGIQLAGVMPALDGPAACENRPGSGPSKPQAHRQRDERQEAKHPVCPRRGRDPCTWPGSIRRRSSVRPERPRKCRRCKGKLSAVAAS